MPANYFAWIGIISLLALSAVLIVFIFVFLTKENRLNSRIEFRELSILIPFRNEKKLHQQLENLRKQVSGMGIKVFWIDDFSERIPANFLNEIEGEPNFRILKREFGNPGKKEAISDGVKQLTTEWVLLMDADTRPSPGFFSRGYLPVNQQWKMVVLPLIPAKSKGFVGRFFNLEFLVLQLVTHASAMLGLPLLANGAALLVKREDYLESLKLRTDFHISSGDDLFALFAFQSMFGPKSIGTAAKFSDPFTAEFPSSFKELWHQRNRWVSKTGQVQNALYLFISVLVLLANISFAFAVISFFFDIGIEPLNWSMIFYFIISFSFLLLAIRSARRPYLSAYIIPAIFAYPFYLSALLLTSFFTKPKWK